MNTCKTRLAQSSSWVCSLLCLASISISCFVCIVPRCYAQQGKKPFTVSDEIGLTFFNSPGNGWPELRVSPDGKYFAVWTERGRLDLNRVEDSLRFYSTSSVKDFLQHSHVSQPPAPVWIMDRIGKEGRIISDWRWLPDSGG